MNHPIGLLLLLLLPVAACGGPTFDPSRFAGTWTGTLSELRSGIKLPVTAEVTPDGEQLQVRLTIPGGATETFVMEVTAEAATLAETSSKRFGRVQGALTAAGELRAEGKDAAAPLDWFELAGTWGDELDARVDFGLAVGPAGRGNVKLRR